jgi:hypothetical protein
MLGSMPFSVSLRLGRGANLRRLAVVLGGVATLPGWAHGQTCTTQAGLTQAQRTEISTAAYRLASAVQGNNAEAVRTDTIAQFASDFTAPAALIHGTSPELAGDALEVTQIYVLDATNRPANDTSEAEFSCPLKGLAAETDFAIPGLPAGRYAFAMVDASGARPWLLSFLLQAQPGGAWKMAGFYQHPLAVASHDGLWYWKAARMDGKDGKSWLAWLLYGEADQLLRPADFVSSTNLDRLRSEQRSITPPALSDGVSEKTPLAIAGPKGEQFRITGLNSAASEDAQQLNLVVHISSTTGTLDPAAATARNAAAAAALLAAHPELRPGFDNVWVVAEVPGGNPFVTERPMAQIVQGR